jgi:hypothetical protein
MVRRTIVFQEITSGSLSLTYFTGTTQMKRFIRLPSIEELEEKRLKAADLGHNMAAQQAPAAEAAAVPAAAGGQQTAAALHDAGQAAASAVSQKSDDDMDSNNLQSRTDDEDETQQANQRDEDESEDRDDNTGNTGATDGATTSADTSENEADDRDEDENETNDSDDNKSGDDDSQSDDNETNSDDDETTPADNNTSDGQTNLTSTLTPTTGNQGTGSAAFNIETNDGTTQKEFSLQVTGLTAGGSPVTGPQEVRVAGVLVGNINLVNGTGSLQFSTNASGTGAAFPANFPTSISSTSSIAIGPLDTPVLTGTLGASARLKSVTAAGEDSAMSSSQTVASDGGGQAQDMAGLKGNEDVQSLDAAFESLRAGDLVIPV